MRQIEVVRHVVLQDRVIYIIC